MEWPYRFPHPADVIAEAADRFRSLSPDERFRQIVELTDLATSTATAASRRADLDAHEMSAEEQWRLAHRRVFEQHAKR